MDIRSALAAAAIVRVWGGEGDFCANEHGEIGRSNGDRQSMYKIGPQYKFGEQRPRGAGGIGQYIVGRRPDGTAVLS
jgi:hypothetical protein